MSIVKPVYLMAGGRGSQSRSTNTILRSIYQDTGKDKPLIAYVGLASGDNYGFYLMISGMLKKAGNCQVKRVVLASPKAEMEKAEAVLQSADIIFMSGGDVEAGMEIIREKNLKAFFQRLYQQGGLFLGVSAGSIMLADEWVRWRDPEDDSTAEIFPCLGIVPVICDTHAEEDNWEELKAALSLKGDGAVGYGIPSGSCLKAYPDDRLEALGGPVVKYGWKGNQIEKLAEIKP